MRDITLVAAVSGKQQTTTWNLAGTTTAPETVGILMMKPKTEIELAQELERIVDKLSQLNVEPADADRLIAETEKLRPVDPWIREQIQETVAEAIRRRNLPKSHISPGSGKTSL